MAIAFAASLTATAQTAHSHGRKATLTVADKTDTVGITVYSDTTASALDADDSQPAAQPAGTAYSRTVTFKDANDPFSLVAYLGTLGVGGVLISLFCVFVILLVIISPLIAVALIAYWLIHRKRAEYRIAEKALDAGQPIPAGVLPKKRADREAIWQKGIKNAAIGAGIIIFGLFFGKLFLAVGAIFVCWGIGQCVIARTSADGGVPVAEDEAYEEIVQEEDSDGAEK